MLCYMASFAQNSNEHLTFKGVPIDGTLKEFVSKMESKGFTFVENMNGTAALRGDFAGYKDCLIGVSTFENSNKVNTIVVIFPEMNDWSYLENAYQKLKDMLIKKYDRPSDCIEEFQGYGSPSDNFEKLHRLKMDQCNYATLFKTPKGDIQLSLEHGTISSCFVRLQYWDKKNTDAIKAQVLDDL